MNFIEYLKVSVYGYIGLGAAVCTTLVHSIAAMIVLVVVAFISAYTYGKKVDKYTEK